MISETKRTCATLEAMPFGLIAPIPPPAHQVKISAPALPLKGKKSNALVNLQVCRILSFGITERGTIFMRYGTATGRGCSFISFSKLLKALNELTEGVEATKSCLVLHLQGVPEVFPLLAKWNNDQLFEDTWQQANDELAAHIESQSQSLAPEIKANIAKHQLLEEIQRRSLVGFPTEEDGDWLIKVCTYSKQVLGHAIASADGKIFVVVNAPGAKEVESRNAAWAINALCVATPPESEVTTAQIARHYRTLAERGIPSLKYERQTDAEFLAEQKKFLSGSRGIVALKDGTVAIDQDFYRLMGGVSQVRGSSVRGLRRPTSF